MNGFSARLENDNHWLCLKKGVVSYVVSVAFGCPRVTLIAALAWIRMHSEVGDATPSEILMAIVPGEMRVAVEEAMNDYLTSLLLPGEPTDDQGHW